MKNIVFNKDAFKKSVSDNVKNLYRKTLTEASRQEIFQAVSYTVKDRQYVAMGCGGNTQLDFKRGNTMFVYALPKK